MCASSGVPTFTLSRPHPCFRRASVGGVGRRGSGCVGAANIGCARLLDEVLVQHGSSAIPCSLRPWCTRTCAPACASADSSRIAYASVQRCCGCIRTFGAWGMRVRTTGVQPLLLTLFRKVGGASRVGQGCGNRRPEFQGMLLGAFRSAAACMPPSAPCGGHLGSDTLRKRTHTAICRPSPLGTRFQRHAGSRQLSERHKIWGGGTGRSHVQLPSAVNATSAGDRGSTNTDRAEGAWRPRGGGEFHKSVGDRLGACECEKTWGARF